MNVLVAISLYIRNYLMRNKSSSIFRLMTASGSLSLLKGQLRELHNASLDVVVVSGGSKEQLSEIASDEGVDIRFIPHLIRPISIGNDLRALSELIRLFRREKPDIVHANTPKASLLGMVAAWICRVPHRIYTVTGLRFETSTGFMRWLLKTMERITCACATKVIPEGQGVKKTLYREHITSKSMAVLHNGNINGIDLEYFDRTPEVVERASQIREEVGGSFAYLFVGRIVMDKGITELIDAFERVHAEHPETRLLLVGTQEPELDPLPDRTRRLIAENDAIIEAGWQDDVRPWFVASDLFTFPSYREGFPNVVMQAGAMGIPSVVTDINGSNEIIIEGQNGTIVPTRDMDALYRKMTEALEQRDRLTEMSAQCRPLIASRYRQEDVWRATLEMYNSL